MDPKPYLHAHAQDRLRTTFGIVASRAEMQDMVRQIQSGEAEFIRGDSNIRKRWRVAVQGVKVPVVYHNKAKRIVTVLKNEWAEDDYIFDAHGRLAAMRRVG